MFCGKCGQEMPDTAKFCPKCGAANPKAAQAAAPRPAPASAPASGPIPVPPRPAVPSPSGMQLAENPFQLGLAVCGLLQIILFFLLSYGRLTNMGRLAYAMYGYDGSGRMTLPTSARLMLISGDASGEAGLALIFSVIFYLPLLLSLAVLVLNLLAMMKIIKDNSVIPVISVVLTAVTMGSHLVSRLMCTVGFGDQNLADFGVISVLFILAVTAVQLVMGILALTKKPSKPLVM